MIINGQGRNDQGMVLIGMLVLMGILAVSAMALNYGTALNTRMAGHTLQATQRHLDASAVLQHSLWELTIDPFYRTAAAGESHTYNGTDYHRKILNSTLSGYSDAVTASVTAPDADMALRATWRYFARAVVAGDDTGLQPHQICSDPSGHLYFADPQTHTIYRRDVYTGDLSAVAGSGVSGYSGNGGLAVSATLNKPEAVALDSSGNLFIADTDNHVIRKVDIASGLISTLAGTGASGYSGDGGAATLAKLRKPRGVFVDAAGGVYLSDTGNHVIRKIDAGIIDTIAGTGSGGYNAEEEEEEEDMEDLPAATATKLNKPHGLVVTSSGNIYFADTDNNRVRKIYASNGKIRTIAGEGSAGDDGDGDAATEAELDKPEAVFVAAGGDIYIADTISHRIRKVDAASGDIDTVAGTGSAGSTGDGGPAVAAKLDKPRGVCLNPSGEIIISDSNNGSLRRVDGVGMMAAMVITEGLGLDQVSGLAVNSDGHLFVADTENHSIRRIDDQGIVTRYAGNGSAGYSGDGGAATAAKLEKPRGVAVDSDGHLYIADTLNHCVRKVNAANGNISTAAGVCENKGYSGDGGAATTAQMEAPADVAVDADGNLYIADTKNHCIRRVDAAGGFITTVAGTGGSSGFSGNGGAAETAQLDSPGGVATDSDGHLYVADTKNHCIRKIAGGVITTVAGIGGSSGYGGDDGAATAANLDEPAAVAVDAAGNLFIADTKNHVIRAVNHSDNTIRTLAGNNTNGFNGNGLPAVDTQMNEPMGIAMGPVRSGRRIFVSDTKNNRIRILGWRIENKIY